MGIVEKSIVDWKVIMLDTSIIITLFHSENLDVTDDDIIFTRELIDYLNDSNSGDNKPRKFLISSIVLTELLSKENDQEKIKKILRVLNSQNVEFVDFDIDTALLFNHNLYPYLSKKKLNRFAEEFGFKTHEYVMAREWIHRDYMIVMSGINNKADVILTADKNTFYPMAHSAGAFCAISRRYLFEKPFSKSITKYFHSKAEKEFITNTMRKLEETVRGE